jgi:hypothetical protein
MGNWGNWTQMERRKKVFPNHVSDQGKKTMGMSQNPMLVNPTAGFKCWCIDVKPPQIYLVGGIPTPLKNMKVNWDDYSQY